MNRVLKVPEGDTKTQEWAGVQGTHAQFFSQIVPVARRGTVLQAGGHVGIFARALSKTFKKVLTFEADAENYACLEANCAGINNITMMRAALGDREGYRWMAHNVPNSGGSFVVDKLPTDFEVPEGFRPGDTVEMITIDSLKLQELNLLVLDIEGYELFAIRGAAETIGAYHPTITVEMNQCSDRYEQQAHMLIKQELGRKEYKEVSRYGRDVIFAWRGQL